MDRHAIMRALNFPTAAVVAHVQSSRYAQPRDDCSSTSSYESDKAANLDEDIIMMEEADMYIND